MRSNAAELSQSDLSAGSIAKIHVVLHSALSHAVRFDLIAHNVAKAVKVADSAVEERRVPPSKRYRSSSARRGTTAWASRPSWSSPWPAPRRTPRAAVARPVAHRTTLFVRRTVQRSSGKLRVAEPKARGSWRQLELPRLTVEALERQHVRQDKKRTAAGCTRQVQGWIFASTIGTAMEPRNVSHRFELIRAKVGMQSQHLHDLHHHCGSYLLAQGVDPRTVMEVLGHSAFRLTIDTCAHVLNKQLDQAASADAMDRALGEAL